MASKNGFEIIEEREELLNLIDKIMQISYAADAGNWEAILDKNIPVSYVASLQDLLKGSDLNAGREKLTEYKKAMENFDLMTLRIGRDLTREGQRKIVEYVREIFGENIVVEFKVSMKVLAGAEIEYKGRYYDGSLSSYFINI